MTLAHVLGIDPGAIAGGWAVVDEMGRLISSGDLPIAGVGAQRMVSAPLFASILKRFTPSAAVIERVSSMPRQGVASSFKFGRGVGIVEGAIGASLVPISWVSPTTWKKHFHLGRDKEAARQLAIATWPDAASLHFAKKKDTHRAEAALIALWWARAQAVAA